MKSMKCFLKSSFFLAFVIGLAIQNPGSALATGKGAWAILTDPSVRWVEYPGSNGQLLYDRETGLIWEKSASTHAWDFWGDGAQYCLNRAYTVNGKQVNGFRLPTAAELTNLGRDVFTQFNNIEQTNEQQFFINTYLSSELLTVNHPQLSTGQAFWGVQFIFNNNQVTAFVEPEDTVAPGGSGGQGVFYRALCVRGGGGSHSGDEMSPF